MAADSGKRTPQRGARQASQPWRQQFDSWLAHHRKVARDSNQRLWRAPVASLLTWLVIGVALALPAAMLVLLGSLQGVSAGWENAARVTVYLEETVTESRARELQQRLATQAGVSGVEFIHREQALAEFREASGLGEALDYLNDNPLPHTLLVTPQDGQRSAEAIDALVANIDGLADVARVQVDLGWLQRLNVLAELLGRAAWVLALMLAAAVVLVIGNTIRLAIENRRDEILVARLVGGTDAFVRRPFLYTGVWYGLGGGIVAFLLLQISAWWLSGPIDRLAALYRSNFSLSGLSMEGTLVLLLVAVALGWLGAWLAVKRHLDAIEPE
ncbi:MAG: permease-like cell division protein FtsX [Marinobacter sp.]|nr:permease-like cell division protein FtsX [Marinobacter sp.]